MASARSELFRTALEPVRADLVRWYPDLLSLEQASLYLSDVWGDHGVTAEAVAELAEQVQEAAVDALWRAGEPTNWPPCPFHPDTHPLDVVVADRVSGWACPVSGAVVATVGELPGPRDR